MKFNNSHFYAIGVTIYHWLSLSLLSNLLRGKTEKGEKMVKMDSREEKMIF